MDVPIASDVRRQAGWLDLTHNAVFATNRAGGPPQLSPVWYRWTGTGFDISAAVGSAKVGNLRRDPSAALCIDDPANGTYCTASGRARILDGDQVLGPTLAVIEKYRPEVDPLEHWEGLLAEDDRVVIQLAPERWIWRSF